MQNDLLRALPKIDTLLAHPVVAESGLPYAALLDAARGHLDELRAGIRAGTLTQSPTVDAIAEAVAARARAEQTPRLRRVINATGVVLHTNLGRAPLVPQAVAAVCAAAEGYSNLEFDLATGGRGSRHDHVEPLLCKLTGAEAAAVFHNNASAVFVLLSALASGRRVAIARGELVEIGGGFRIPDIMERTGASLVEVGTTNKTRLSDYASPPDIGAYLKVHTSNFKVVGFTEEASIADLAALGRERGIPVLYDLGSGAMNGAIGLPDGPNVADAVAAGADVVCFSGDKLLGGPQAGVVVGRRDFIEKIKRDPYARVARADKLALAALEATLRLYQDPAAARREVPILRMLTATAEELRGRAEALAARLPTRCGAVVVPSDGEVGGGALPGVTLPGYAVELHPAGRSADEFARILRTAETPIIGRIVRDRLRLELRSLSASDEDEIAAALEAVG